MKISAPCHLEEQHNLEPFSCGEDGTDYSSHKRQKSLAVNTRATSVQRQAWLKLERTSNGSQCLHHLPDHIFDLPPADSSHGGGFDKVRVRDVPTFSVHHGAVLTVDAGAGGEVVGR